MKNNLNQLWDVYVVDTIDRSRTPQKVTYKMIESGVPGQPEKVFKWVVEPIIRDNARVQELNEEIAENNRRVINDIGEDKYYSMNYKYRNRLFKDCHPYKYPILVIESKKGNSTIAGISGALVGGVLGGLIGLSSGKYTHPVGGAIAGSVLGAGALALMGAGLGYLANEHHVLPTADDFKLIPHGDSITTYTFSERIDNLKNIINNYPL